MELEKKLVKLRKQSGMSQLEVAEELSVSRQAISRWEVGSAVPSSDNLRLLSKLYHVSLDYLMDDTAEEPEQMSAVNGKTGWSVCFCPTGGCDSSVPCLRPGEGKGEQANQRTARGGGDNGSRRTISNSRNSVNFNF